MGEIEELGHAIKRLHGCDAVHIGSESVHEEFQGKTVWDGLVQVFDLVDHAKAKRCYAWRHLHGKNDEEVRYVAVLHVPPVVSATTAVRASIVQEFKNPKAEPMR